MLRSKHLSLNSSRWDCEGSAGGNRLDAALLQVQVIRRSRGLRLCYSPGSWSLWGLLNMFCVALVLRGASQLRLHLWLSRHASLAITWWVSLILKCVRLCVRVSNVSSDRIQPIRPGSPCRPTQIVMFVTSSGQNWNYKPPPFFYRTFFRFQLQLSQLD